MPEQEIDTYLSSVTFNEPLAQHTTFKIGGAARYFFVAQDSEDVIKAAQAAQRTNTPFFILGGGSNLLVSDEGFNGLVIKIENTKYMIHDATIEAGAGAPFSKLVIEAANHSLSGLEWATGIPGTIGGAVRGNAGAYGHAIGEMVEKVKVLKIIKDANTSILASMEVKDFFQEECKFEYRDSIFKQNKNLIILEVVLKLSHGDREKSLQQMRELITTRQGKLPQESCAGSVFKNYELRTTDYGLLRQKFSRASDEDIKIRLNYKKIPSAWLIEQCGLKGQQIGQAQISPRHANTIVNLGGAQAKDVLALINLIKQQVRDKFNIQLEEEIELVGFEEFS